MGENEEAIEFGSVSSMMEDMIDEGSATPLLSEAVTEDTPAPHIIEVKNGELPPLPKSEKPEFNPEAATHALKDSEEVEGGISTARSASASLSSAGELGGRVISQPNMDSASLMDKYEVTGFTVEVSLSPNNMSSIRVRDHFDTLEEVMASVDGSRYLMPIKPKGFKVTKITSGAPIVCFNERQMYEYMDGKWRKT